MITKIVESIEFDCEKISRGDIVSYLSVMPGFRDRYVKCHGIVSSINRGVIHITGTIYDGRMSMVLLRGEDVERLEITVIIRNENTKRK